MQFHKKTTLFLSTLMLTLGVAYAGADKPVVNNSTIYGTARFLEQSPLSKYAPVLRAQAMQWESKSKDVVDVVCPPVLAPLAKDSFNYPEEYKGILFGQFVIGSAAYQIANPSQKGRLMPQQLAGMRSMLATYRVLLAVDPSARIKRFDELSKHEAHHTLAEVLKPVVESACK